MDREIGNGVITPGRERGSGGGPQYTLCRRGSGLVEEKDKEVAKMNLGSGRQE